MISEIFLAYFIALSFFSLDLHSSWRSSSTSSFNRQDGEDVSRSTEPTFKSWEEEMLSLVITLVMQQVLLSVEWPVRGFFSHTFFTPSLRLPQARDSFDFFILIIISLPMPWNSYHDSVKRSSWRYRYSSCTPSLTLLPWHVNSSSQILFLNPVIVSLVVWAKTRGSLIGQWSQASNYSTIESSRRLNRLTCLQHDSAGCVNAFLNDRDNKQDWSVCVYFWLRKAK